MKQLFAYIRVSTAKQGKGVSLDEQRSAIENYALRKGARIVGWFEEKQTAAKAGRPIFNQMLKRLRKGEAVGVIVHKIDRGTRNYHDWAAIDDLLSTGVEVYSAIDDLDMTSRGGRLAADIQVAMAVDYIRNLREETLKGIEGRLKQGILPHQAPIGYLNMGKGKPKAIDPVQGPIVRKLFELYASGAHTLRTITRTAEEMGLRNRHGNPFRLGIIHRILTNSFYAGILRSERFGVFAGAHESLVTHVIFERVQAVLAGKFIRRTRTFSFPFRRLIHCATCGRSLVGSERKGYIYYRCQTISCPTTSLRETAIEEAVRSLFASITLPDKTITLLREELRQSSATEATLRDSRIASLHQSLSATNARMARLTNLLIDGTIEKDAYREHHGSLVLERQKAEQDLAVTNAQDGQLLKRADQLLGMLQSPRTVYETGDEDQKRRLLEILISDGIADGKKLEFSWREPFAAIAARQLRQQSGPYWNTTRTFSAEELLAWCAELPPSFDETP